MKWRHKKSSLKRWVEKHRQEGYERSPQIVLAILPRKIGCWNGPLVYWLSPIKRTRKSTSWKSSWCLDLGYSSWWYYYDDSSSPASWKGWAETRPVHHLVGLVNLVVCWFPLWITLGVGIYALSRVLGGLHGS